jgi:CelD/BcsL family acetyltransferase involved in cellulose biosynthesis
MLTIRPLIPEDKLQWDEFVSSSQQATIFHTFDWEEILHFACPSETTIYWGMWLDNTLVAIWPSAVVSVFGGKILRSLPHSNIGEPIIRQDLDATVFHKMVLHVTHSVKKKDVLHWSAEVRADSSAVNLLTSYCGFRAELSTNCTFRLDTTADSRVLWTNLARDKKRAIRKAEYHGLEICESSDQAELTKYFEIYKVTMKRHSREGLEQRFFDLVYTNLVSRGKAKLFLANYRGKVVAGIILLLHAGRAHWWSGASAEEAWQVHANDLLLWHAIQWASKVEIRTIDLGPTPSDPASGLNIFKRHFGAQRLDLLELTLPISKLRNSVITNLVHGYRGLVAYGIIPATIAKSLKKQPWYD